MKKIRIFFAILAVALVTAVAIVSCKKEQNKVASLADTSEAMTLMNRIKLFHELCEAVNAGIKAEGTMTLEEMRQILDLTSNYDYSKHMTSCENTILDTLYVPMPPVDEEGNVTEMDVVSTYETFETELQQLMAKVEDNRDVHSYFSIVMPKDVERAEGYITVVFIRGEESKEARGGRNTYDEDGPFVEGNDWYWGDDLGLCKWDPVNATADATDMLSNKFGYVIPEGHQDEIYFVQNVMHVNYRPCEHLVPYVSSHYYVDINMEDCADTWLFYYASLSPSDLCLMWYDLNCYWRSINRNFVDSGAPLHHPDFNTTNSPYHCCFITWHRFYADGYYHQVHVAHVTYCDVVWENDPLPPVD